MWIVSQQTIYMKYHAYFFLQNIFERYHNVSSGAVVIDVLLLRHRLNRL